MVIMVINYYKYFNLRVNVVFMWIYTQKSTIIMRSQNHVTRIIPIMYSCCYASHTWELRSSNFDSSQAHPVKLRTKGLKSIHFTFFSSRLGNLLIFIKFFFPPKQTRDLSSKSPKNLVPSTSPHRCWAPNCNRLAPHLIWPSHWLAATRPRRKYSSLLINLTADCLLPWKWKQSSRDLFDWRPKRWERERERERGE